MQALREAEATMTVCEVATHRIFVGLQHSRQLLRRPALWQHWLDVLDGLGGFVDLVPGRGPGQQTSGPGGVLLTGAEARMHMVYVQTVAMSACNHARSLQLLQCHFVVEDMRACSALQLRRNWRLTRSASKP